MAKLFERSLLLRLGLMMATITVLAVTGMGVSVVVAEMLEGQASAINQAGSLRMQSYRILTTALAGDGRDPLAHQAAVEAAEREFDDRLTSPRLVDVLPTDGNHALRRSYSEVVATWIQACRPLIHAYVAEVARAQDADPGSAAGAALRDARALTRESVDTFVARIDQLVRLLEEETESKVAVLRATQGAALFLTVVVVFLTMYSMQTDVVVPLSDLLDFAGRTGAGDLSQRVQHAGGDELGRLGLAFNAMAEDLSKLYGELEARVEQKTAELQRSNRALELLYRTLSRLNEGTLSNEAWAELLGEIQATLGLSPAALCVLDPGQAEARVRASSFPSADRRPPACAAPRCEPCIALTGPRLRQVQGPDASASTLLSVPLSDQERNYGVLTLGLPPAAGVEGWQVQLAEAVGQHIGMAIGNAGRVAQDRRMALLEERGTMARELHDSLAQSLSYLKIQVTRLQALVGRADGAQAALPVVDELRSGLNDAYRQLRELLATFRIRIDGRGLPQALEETVEEFRPRTAAELVLDNRLLGCLLTPNEEIHVLQVVREALSNVARHSHAGRAEVRLDCTGEGGVRVLVEDNGVGLPPSAEHRHHYGLAIMRERAHHLGGELSVEPRPGGGTRVSVAFVPALVRRADEAARAHADDPVRAQPGESTAA